LLISCQPKELTREEQIEKIENMYFDGVVLITTSYEYNFDSVTNSTIDMDVKMYVITRSNEIYTTVDVDNLPLPENTFPIEVKSPSIAVTMYGNDTYMYAKTSITVDIFGFQTSQNYYNYTEREEDLVIEDGKFYPFKGDNGFATEIVDNDKYVITYKKEKNIEIYDVLDTSTDETIHAEVNGNGKIEYVEITSIVEGKLTVIHMEKADKPKLPSESELNKYVYVDSYSKLFNGIDLGGFL
jgi:hypothetical protein